MERRVPVPLRGLDGAKRVGRLARRPFNRPWAATAAVAIFVLLAGVAVALPPHRAGAAAAGGQFAPSVVGQNSGAFTTSIPIDIPGYHGLAPNLALVYSSTAGNGPFGEGWQLSGQSAIVRVSPGRGSPMFDANDIYLLDGEQLVPSTAQGGTHVTKRQSYQRISYDAIANSWTVQDTNGVRHTYSTVFSNQRWLLTSITDLHGNVVTYLYHTESTVDGPKEIYLETIMYNRVAVRFMFESRPDMITKGSNNLVAKMDLRVKTIEVTANSSLVRAYALTYEASPNTGRSLLRTVRQYGKDAFVGNDGVITGGTALPPVDLQYSSDTESFAAATTWVASFCGGYGISYTAGADFNGDGRGDLYCHADIAPYASHVKLSDGLGSFVPGGTWLANWCSADIGMADFDGDGKTDLWCHNATNGAVHIGYSTGFEFIPVTANFGGTAPFCQGGAALDFGAADVNGDGKAELWCHNKNTGATNIAINNQVNQNAAFAASANWYTHTDCATAKFGFGDFNGDGKADQWCYVPNSLSLGRLTTMLSTGTGFVYNRVFYFCSTGEVGAGDFNGDGRGDLYCHENGTKHVWGAVSDGVSPTRPRIMVDTFCTTAGFSVADVNGDGRTDMVCHNPTTATTTVALTVNTDTTSWTVRTSVWNSSFCSTTNFGLGDFNGDGKVDLWCHSFTAGTAFTKVSLSGTRVPLDKLVRIKTALGAVTTITYNPASTYTQLAMPYHSLPPGGMPFVAAAVNLQPRPGDPVGTVTYHYWYPNWDSLERRFLGFTTVEASNTIGGTATSVFRVASGYPTNRMTSAYRGTGSGLWEVTEQTYTESITNGIYVSKVSARVAGFCPNSVISASCQSARTTYTYDQYGNVLTETDNGDTAVSGDEKLTTTTYRYDTANFNVSSPLTVTVQRGLTSAGATLMKSSFGYNAVGDRTSAGRLDVATNRTLTTSSTYDRYGNQLSATDELLHTVSYTYDTTFNTYQTKVCNALVQCSLMAWDLVLGVATSSTDVNGQVELWAYDALGRRTKETRPDGSTMTTSYVSWGDPSFQYQQDAVSDGTADGLWRRTYLDGLGRTIKAVAEPDVTVLTTYNAQGMVATTSNPYRTGQTPVYTAYQYDGFGNLVKTTLPDGRTRTTSYGLAVNAADSDFATPRYAATSCDERNVCRRTAYDGHLNPIVVSEWNGVAEYRTRAVYNELGQLVRLTDAVGNVTIQTWDTLGRKKSTTDPDNGTWIYGYDDGGHVTSQTDGRGEVINSTYDAIGRLKTQSAGSVVLLTNTYDQVGHGAGIGRITSTTDGSGSTSWTYDGLGRTTQVVKTIGASTYTLKETYDAAGRRASITYPDNEVVSYTYDSMGCLNKVGAYVTAASCTPSMALAGMTLGDGVSITNTYDANRLWLNSDTVKNSAGAVLQSESYGHDASGRVTSKTSTDTKDQWTYVYDALGRLTTATNTTTPAYNASYTYDSIGRLLSGTGMGTMTYPAAGAAHPHAPNTANGKTFTYNAAGQRTSDGTSTYTYDVMGRLASVTTGTTTVSYTYDGRGNRVRAGAATNLFLDGQLVYQINGAATSKFYYYGPSRVARKDSSGAVYYYVGNQLGSPHLILNSTGGVVRSDVYGPYGTLLSTTGTLSDPFGMAGEYRDSASLYQMGSRYLSVQVGQFLTPDTSGSIDITAPQTLNRYAYALNDPINHTDPSGQSAISPLTMTRPITFAITDTSPKQFQINLNLNPIVYSYTFPNGDLPGKLTTTIAIPVYKVFSVELVAGAAFQDFSPVGAISGLNVAASIPFAFSGKLKAESMFGPGSMNPQGGFYFRIKAEGTLGVDPQVHMKTLLDMPKDFARVSELAPEAGSPFESPQGFGQGITWVGDIFDLADISNGGIPGFNSLAESIFFDVGMSIPDFGLDSPFSLSLTLNDLFGLGDDPFGTLPGFADAIAGDPVFGADGLDLLGFDVYYYESSYDSYDFFDFSYFDFYYDYSNW